MKSIFKKITALGLFSFVLLGVGFNVNASGGGSGGGGGSSSTSSSLKISAPVFNTGWVINGTVKRVCWGLPEHASWNTGSVNGTRINSVYGDLMSVTVSVIQEDLLGILTPRANPIRCPIICDEGYTYNSTTISCDKIGGSTINGCENGYTKIGNDCLQNQKVITINATSCPDNVAPQNAHYVKEEDTVNLKFDGTYTNPDCEWICDDNYVLSGNNCLSIEELEENISLTIDSKPIPTQKRQINETSEITIFGGTIKTNNFVTIDNLEIEMISGSIDNGEEIDMTLYVEGDTYATEYITENHALFSNIGETSSKNPLGIQLRITPLIKSEKDLKFRIKALGTGPNGESITSDYEYSTKITFLDTDVEIITYPQYSTPEVKIYNEDDLLYFNIYVEDGEYELMDISIGLNAPITGLENFKIIVDDYDYGYTTYTGGDSLDFQRLDKTLTSGKHLVYIMGDIDLGDDISNLVEFNKIKVNNKIEKNINIKRLFVKAYPTISLFHKDSHNNEMTLKINNYMTSEEDITISGLIFNDGNNIGFLALDGKTLSEPFSSTYIIDPSDQVTLAEGDSTTLDIGVSNNTVQLNGIIVNIDGNDVIFTDEYANLAKWANLKITHMD